MDLAELSQRSQLERRKLRYVLGHKLVPERNGCRRCTDNALTACVDFVAADDSVSPSSPCVSTSADQDAALDVGPRFGSPWRSSKSSDSRLNWIHNSPKALRSLSQASCFQKR